MFARSMKKGSPAMFLIILMTFASVGTILYYSQSSDSSENEGIWGVAFDPPDVSRRERMELLDSCESEDGVQQSDWCYLNLAREYMLDECSEIVQKDHRTFCEAIVDSDPNTCDNIGSDSLKESCMISLARVTGDGSLCEDVSREDYCLSNLD